MRLNWRAVCLMTVAVTGLVPVGAAAAAPAGASTAHRATGCVTVTATIPVGRVPQLAAVNPATNTVYVTNFGASTVSVINGQTNTVTATIRVGPAGSEPYGVAVNPATNTAYVATLSKVSVISGQTNTVTATIHVGRLPQGSR